MTTTSRYAFKVDYYDPQANLTRQYLLLYYTEDATIEMHDLKTKRVFLKRCAYPSLGVQELFIGATVNIFSRSLKLVDYGDEATRQHFSAAMGEFILIITENGFRSVGTIVDKIISQGLRIKNIRLVDLPDNMCLQFGISSRCIVILVKGSEAAEKVVLLNEAFQNVTVVVSNPTDVGLLSDVAFGPGKTTAMMKNCSICVIKPHAITSGYQGAIIQRLIDEGFYITALGMYTLSLTDAEDFLEVYNGVVPEYKRLVEQMSSGPCWAIEVYAENAVTALRAVCGPHDPEVCHVLFPHTIRSKYGIDRTRNSVHCTDLEEDAPLESEFFFSLLQNL
ncbi:nucleoside diphosphate kinase, putative [Trypanosoma cruzi]|uniref:Nucleoside diphosphate kinase, putative n=1 Tax=Trypanosoma cruzi (strain CL Brener) TaxID=353153 RepID=Q4E4R9_TRYCC|nr:nucleoside diphosphate kinase, putative [Trypanosoma cruzi]EAN99781.1 nucleoside diphosphate kinase, putative [Trypanosoma cruzi]|eukprot:XP_821632.1 nucleoside diphosphate kinase [Trypanosoma cruzi strain CL Brener]